MHLGKSDDTLSKTSQAFKKLAPYFSPMVKIFGPHTLIFKEFCLGDCSLATQTKRRFSLGCWKKGVSLQFCAFFKELNILSFKNSFVLYCIRRCCHCSLLASVLSDHVYKFWCR